MSREVTLQKILCDLNSRITDNVLSNLNRIGIISQDTAK